MIIKMARLEEQDGSRCQMSLIQRSIGVVAFGGAAEDEDRSQEAVQLVLEVQEMQANDWKVVR